MVALRREYRRSATACRPKRSTTVALYVLIRRETAQSSGFEVYAAATSQEEVGRAR